MGTVSGLSKERMLAIEAACITAGAVDLTKHLILTRHDGTSFDAGVVGGPQGAIGAQGAQGPQGLGPQGSQGNQGYQGSQGVSGVGAYAKAGANSGYGSLTLGASVYSTVLDLGSVVCNGLPIAIDFSCRLQRDGGTNGNLATFAVFVEGFQVSSAEAGELTYRVDNQNVEGDTFTGTWVITPAAGTKVIQIKGKGNHTAGFFYVGYPRSWVKEIATSGPQGTPGAQGPQGSSLIEVYAENNADQGVTADGAWRDMPTVGPSVTVPSNGDWMYEIICNMYPSATGTVQAGLSIASANPAAPNFASQYIAAGVTAEISTFGKLVGLTAGQVLKMVYSSNGGGVVNSRWRKIHIRKV